MHFFLFNARGLRGMIYKQGHKRFVSNSQIGIYYRTKHFSFLIDLIDDMIRD